MKVKLLALLLNFPLIHLKAFEPWYGYSTNGLAGISTFNVKNFNPYYNPAQLNDSIKLSIDLFRNQINGLSGIKANYLGLTKLCSNSFYSMFIANFGTDGYQEFKIGIANGLKLNSKLSLGMNTSFNRIIIIGNGQSSYLNSNISFMSSISKNNTFAAICEFPYRFKRSDFNHLHKTTTLKIGWCNFSSKKLRLLAEICLNTINPLIARFGLCYHYKPFNFILGFEPRSKTIGAGISFKIKKSQVGISNIHHIGLGQVLCFEANYVKK